MPATPQQRWPLLDARCGTAVWVKHENQTPVGAFKVRGGLVYFDHLRSTPAGRARRRRGHARQPRPVRRHSRRGRYCDTCRGCRPARELAGKEPRHACARRRADREWARFSGRARGRFCDRRRSRLAHGAVVRPAAGSRRRVVCARVVQGCSAISTCSTFQSGSDRESAVRSRCATRRSADEDCRRRRRQPLRRMRDRFALGRAVSHEATTRIADGMACRTPVPEALSLIRAGAERVIEVTDDEIEDAMRALFEDTHNVVEGAGAAALAAVTKDRGELRGRTVGDRAVGRQYRSDRSAASSAGERSSEPVAVSCGGPQRSRFGRGLCIPVPLTVTRMAWYFPSPGAATSSPARIGCSVPPRFAPSPDPDRSCRARPRCGRRSGW